MSKNGTLKNPIQLIIDDFALKLSELITNNGIEKIYEIPVSILVDNAIRSFDTTYRLKQMLEIVRQQQEEGETGDIEG